MAVKWVSKPIWRGEVSTGLRFIKIIYMIHLCFSSHYDAKLTLHQPLHKTQDLTIVIPSSGGCPWYMSWSLQPRVLEPGMGSNMVLASGVYHILRWGAGWRPNDQGKITGVWAPWPIGLWALPVPSLGSEITVSDHCIIPSFLETTFMVGIAPSIWRKKGEM